MMEWNVAPIISSRWNSQETYLCWSRNNLVGGRLSLCMWALRSHICLLYCPMSETTFCRLQVKRQDIQLLLQHQFLCILPRNQMMIIDQTVENVSHTNKVCFHCESFSGRGVSSEKQKTLLTNNLSSFKLVHLLHTFI